MKVLRIVLLATLLLGPSVIMAQTKPLDEIQISVAHYPVILQAVPVQVGMTNGIFEKHGIKITKVVASEGGGADIRNVVQGHFPFADVALPATINAYNLGAKVAVIAGDAGNVSDLACVTAADSSYHTINDLVGKSVAATNPGSASQGTILINLRGAKIDPAKVSIVYAGSTANTLVMIKDQKVGCGIVAEPILTSMVAKKEAREVFNGAQFAPKFTETVYVTTPEYVQQHPDLVKRFVEAIRESIAAVNADPEKAGKLWAKEADIDEATGVAVVKHAVATHHYSVALDSDAFNAAVDAMSMSGQIKAGTPINWSALIDQQFLAANEKVNLQRLIATAR